MQPVYRAARLIGVTSVLLWASFGVAAQPPVPTVTPSPPPPGVTLPSLTPVPTAILVNNPLPLPDLQPITRHNVTGLEQLFTLQCRMTGIPGYQPEIQDLVFSPVENRLVIVAQGLTCIYNLNMPEVPPVTIDVTGWSSAGAFFSADGRSLYTLHAGNEVFEWNMTTGEQQTTELQGVYISNVGQNLALSPDGSLLATGTQYWLRLWDMAAEELVVNVNVGRVTALAWSGDGSRLATIEEERLGLYTLYPGPRLFRDELLPTVGRRIGLAFGGPAGDLLAYTNGDHVVVMDVSSNEVIATPEIDSSEMSRLRQQELVYNPVDPFMLLGTGRETFTLWDVEADEHLWDYTLDPFLFTGSEGHAAFNADGTLLVLGGGESLTVWGVPQ